MKKKKGIIIRTVWIFIAGIAFGIVAFFYAGTSPANPGMEWGLNFAPRTAIDLGLDWKAALTAMLDDLKGRKFRISAQWDAVEPKEGEFDFSDVDWQLDEIARRGGEVILAIGMKTPRWPECHIPPWAPKDKKELQQKILVYEKQTIERYKSRPEIVTWQVENEPFVEFGDCPWKDEDFLRQEIAAVRSLDASRKILVNDSGEWSTWFTVARSADIVGTTLYRRVWFGPFGRYINYPFTPVMYRRKAWLIKTLFGKEMLNVELQAEPWGGRPFTEMSNAEMDKTMSFKQFQSNIDFASRAGSRAAYFWGSEWWYYMKEKRGDARFWKEARKVLDL